MDRLTFFSHLRQSRLLPEEQLADIVARFGTATPAQAVAAALVADGQLTRFQARQLWAGQIKGLVLGQYRLLEELGKGGFGHVYKAVHGMMGRVVALKVISPELVRDSRARDWFKREVLAVTQLSHPNIVMAYDANEVDDALFLVMEFIDGPSLEAVVREKGPLPIGPSCVMLRQAAQALQYAHDKGMVHRDIKPANLLVARSAATPEGVPVIKVVDFGLARLHTTSTAQTLMLKGEKSFLGTPDYVSPEQARDVHAVDIRSDLYSLGCTFYYALAGRRPFQGSTVLETVVKHLQEEADPLEGLRPEVPAALAAIIRKLMAKDPNQRFQTPAELAAALGPLCQAPEVSSAREILAGSLAPGSAVPFPGRAELEALPATALVPALAFWSEPRGATAPPLPATARGRAQVASAEEPRPAGCGVIVAVSPVVETRGCCASGETPREIWSATKIDVLTPIETTPHAVPTDPSPEVSANLRASWQQWAAVVEVIADGKGSQEIGAAAYRKLHGRLLAACRSELPAATGAKRALLQKLEALVEPWLTPYNLATADREALASLVQRCRLLDCEVGSAEKGVAVLRWAALFGTIVLGLFMAGWLCQQQNLAPQLRHWAGWLWQQGLHNPVISMAILLPVVVLATVYLFSRLFRN